MILKIPAALLTVPAAGYIISTIALIFSKRGVDEIVHERGEDVERLRLAKNTAAVETRARLARMRIPHADVRQAIEYFLLVSGNILAAAGAQKRYLPQTTDAIDDVLGICSSYMESLESASISSRYGAAAEKTVEDTVAETARRIRFAAERLDELRKIELPRPGSPDLPEDNWE